MKKCIFLCVLCALLCVSAIACGRGTNEETMSEEESLQLALKAAMEKAMEGIDSNAALINPRLDTTANTETTTLKRSVNLITSVTKVGDGFEITFHDPRSTKFFSLRLFVEDEEVNIPEMFRGEDFWSMGTGKKWVHCTLQQTDLPNTKVLTLGEGIEIVTFGDEQNVPVLETLRLSSTVEVLGVSRWVLNEMNFLEMTSDLAVPKEMTALKTIEVAEENETFRGEAGILYRLSDMIGGERVPSRWALFCVPQNYQAETVTVAEGTKYMHYHAVYHCRNVTTLTVPDSVTLIDEEAIVATSAHPLTVVCSRGSAAEAYVLAHAEEYYLKIAYAQ